jgi:hypothetical protein
MKNIIPFNLFEMSKYSSKEWNEIVFEFCKYTQDNRKEIRDKVENLAINSEFDCERNKYLPNFYIQDGEDNDNLTWIDFDKDNVDKDSNSFNFDDPGLYVFIIKDSQKYGSRTISIKFHNTIGFDAYNDTFILTIQRSGRKASSYTKQFKEFPLISLKNPKKVWVKILNIIEQITNEEFNPRFE